MEEQLIALITGIVGVDKLQSVTLWVSVAAGLVSVYTVLVDPLLPPATESSSLAYKIWCRVAKYICGNFGHNRNKEGTV